jgi:L-ribulokinase
VPEENAVARYEPLYQLYRKLYFAFGSRNAEAVGVGDVLPQLRAIAEQVRSTS